MTDKTCDIEGCEKPARSRIAELCPMHYHRAYRHGDTSMVAVRTLSVSNGRLYKTRGMKHHPLASKHGIVYVHRQVLFDTIGAGVHQCHWCSADIEWFLDKSDPRSIHVDHLNNMGDDNRPENLAPSCQRCNGARGSQRRSDALREAGFWSGNDTVAALRSPSQQRRPRVAARPIPNAA